MINVINNQIELVLEDLELITDPYQRGMVRTSLIGALTQTQCSVTEVSYELEGKEAIKHNKPKAIPVEENVEEPITFTKIGETPEEGEADVTHTEEEAVEPAPKEIDIEPEIQEPVIIEYVDEEGTTQSLDITEAWNMISPSMLEAEVPEEEILELAQNITAYSLMPIYSTFKDLKDCENKMMLAYYLQGVGLEDINNVIINEITDGQCSDIYELVNDDNLEFIVTSIAERLDDSEEE